MDNLVGESQLGLKEKGEKLKIKFIMKNSRENAFNKAKEVDKSRSDSGEGSSKDLGGHMRVYRDLQITTVKENEAVSGEKHACTICKRSFPSPKALFGHMRCHPERSHRGMKPLVNSSRPITTSLESCLLSLPAGCKRPRTFRRGSWPAIVRRECSMKDDEDEEELVKGAVYGLMFLATGDDRYRSVPSKHDDKIRVWDNNYNPSPEEAVSSSDKKRRICGYDDDDDDEGKNHKGKDVKVNENELEMVVYNMETGNGTSSGIKRKRKNETNQKTAKSYTCSICSKCFSSPQALGGHTSSAHGNKMLIKNAGGQEQVVVVEDGVNLDDCPKDEELCGIMIGRGGGGIHECKICGKEFSSGQDLGGHMRLHWQAPPPQAANPLALSLAAPDSAGVVVEAQAQGEEQVVRKQVFMCFDLNEIPADDDFDC